MKTSVDLSHLRHPWERPIWVGAVLLNLLLCALALTVAIRGGERIFEALPLLRNYEKELVAAATVFALTPPLLVLARNRRHARTLGGSVPVTPTQFAIMHEQLLAHCRKLGVSDVPELYVSDEVIKEHARAFSAWHCEYIVVATDFLEKDLAPLRDVWSFLLGRELGRLALGHTEWLDELLIAYVDRFPFVRRPLRHVRAYSLDAIGAYLEPEGVRGLIIQVSGRRTLPTTNLPEYIEYATTRDGFWYRVANLVEERPHLAVSMQKLYDRGLFDLGKDLTRFERKDPA